MNSVAIAIDWSMRVNVRSRKSRSSSTGVDFSASTQICAIVSTVSTGYLPDAVSADSITASVPSSTALATSDTSARVGTGLLDHRLHHLRCGDRELVALARHADHPFLQAGHRRVADFDGEVAARDHDAVGGVDDLRQRDNRLGALDLRDHLRLAACGEQQLARHVHVFLALRKRHREVVGLDLDRRLDVVHVLGRQRGRGQAAAQPVDPLVVRQRAAQHHARDDARPVDGLDDEPDQAVVEQQDRAGRDVARKLLVVEADLGRRLRSSIRRRGRSAAPARARPCRRRTCRRGSSVPAGPP